MDSHIFEFVRQRASHRCEYCHLPAWVTHAPFQVDHIVARQHGGSSELSNFALSCIHCNRYKGPNIAGINQNSGSVIRLFNPRKEHFRWSDAELIGLTAIGRATIQVLRINDPEMLNLRQQLAREGAWEL